MQDILEQMSPFKRTEVAAGRAENSLDQLDDQIRRQTPPRGFAAR